MFLHVSPETGSVYGLDDQCLIMTPLHDDMTFDTDWDNWIEVDETSLMNESNDVLDHITWVESKLRSL